MVLALQHEEPMCPFKDPPPETIDPLENEVKYINYLYTYTHIINTTKNVYIF